MDQRLSLTQVLLELVTHAAQIGIRVGRVPALSRAETAQPIGRFRRSLAENEPVVLHPDVEPVASLDAKAAACLARDRDLVLGTDLCA
jgi:hypothetical protein